MVLFTDSKAVRGSFLKSWSANEDSDRLMDVIVDMGKVEPSGKSAKGIVTPQSPKTGEKARLWGKCHRHFSIFKKRSLLALLLQF